MSTHPIPTGSPLTPEQLATMDAKERMVVTAAKLFQRQGYHATGLKQVVEEAAAPRGSIYHHFPGGKEDLGVQAVARAASALTRVIERASARTDSPGGLVRTLGEGIASWLTTSAYTEGCPVSTVTLEVAPMSAALTEACHAAYDQWVGMIGDCLVDHGIADDEARDLAVTTVSGVLGALLLCRVGQSTAPLRTTADQLARVLDARVAAIT